MGAARERIEEALHLFAEQRVVLDRRRPLVELGLRRQPTEQQQVGDFQERAVLGEVLDAVAAMAEQPVAAVHVRDGALGARRIGESRVVGDDAFVGAKTGYVQAVVADGRFHGAEIELVSIEVQAGVTHLSQGPFGAGTPARGPARRV